MFSKKSNRIGSIFMIIVLTLSLFLTPMQSVAYAVSANQSADEQVSEDGTESDGESSESNTNTEESTETTSENVKAGQESGETNIEVDTEKGETTETTDETVKGEEESRETNDDPETVGGESSETQGEIVNNEGESADSDTVSDPLVKSENNKDDEFDYESFEILVDETTTSNSITINWETNQKVDEFDLLLNGEMVATVSDVNTFTFENLNAGEWYDIMIRSVVNGEYVYYQYEYIQAYWTNEELNPARLIFMFNEDPNYDEYLLIRGIDEDNKEFLFDDWLYSSSEELLLPNGKFEVIIYDSYDYSIQAVHEIMIEEDKDYINNPIQLQFKLKQMRADAEPFDYEIADVTEDSFTLKWNDVSKITGFEITANSSGEDSYHYIEPQIIDRDKKEYTLHGLNTNLTYYINFYSNYVNDLTMVNYFKLKTLGKDAEAPAVSFESDVLQEAAAEELGIYLREITEADIERLTYLDIWNEDINSLAGLQYAKNLEGLGAYNNNISDIRVLEGLKKLSWLELDYNTISDISPLANLVELEDLNLRSNNIEFIDSLSNLTKLSSLQLDDNNIANIEALSNMKGLEYLGLYSNNIKDITVLGNLLELKDLELAFNEITNIDVLGNLTNLESLHLSVNKIEDIRELSNLTALEYLSIEENNIVDISSLETLVNLQDLSLSWNEITDIEALSNLTDLEYLNLGSNHIKDISALKNLTNLQTLVLNNNEITDITVLKELPYLQTVYLYGNDITDTETVQYLRNDGVEVYYSGDDWNDWEDEDSWSDWDGEVDIEEVLQTFPEDQGFVLSEDGRNISLDLNQRDSEETVELTKEQIKLLRDNRQNIEVKKDGVQTTIPGSAFEDDDEPVTISVIEQEPVPNSLSNTYDFTIKQGAKNISTFDDGVMLTFNVNADRANNPNNLKVYYYNEDLKIWENIGGSYSNGTVTVATYHFSTFTVFEVAEAGSDEILPVEGAEDEETETPGDGTSEGSAGTEEDPATEADESAEGSSNEGETVEETESDSQGNSGSSEDNETTTSASDNDEGTTQLTSAEEQTGDANRLPSTATSMFNVMFAGIILLAAGTAVYLLNRRRQNV